jgi:hypothetical protein
VAGKLGVERDVIFKARQYGIRAQSTLRLPQRGDLWRALRECEAMQRLNEHHRRERSGDSGDAPAHDPCAGSQRGRARRPKPPQVLWFCLPRPLPTAEGIGAMPWWAPLGGVIGAFAVIAGLLFVEKVGAGAFAGLTITANILMSLAIDHFGLFDVQQHSMGPGRAVGALLMVAGIFAISKF